jgi:putative nucleotidyltransferase with HDIG domain
MDTVAAVPEQVGQRSTSILVVDDDAMVLQVMAAGLRQAGYQVTTTSNPLEGLRLLRESACDLVISDAYMPEMDGLTLTETANGIFPELPIIMLTGFGTVDLMREGLRRGASDFITKPFRVRDIPLVVERNLERKRLEIERLTSHSGRILFQAITALLTAVDAKEQRTAQHSRRVAHISLKIGQALRLPEPEMRVLELGAWMHDVGKIGTPDAILRKSEALTEEEWHIMRQHAEKGGEIIAQIEDLRYLSSIIRHHHERYDGTGYPDGLKAEAIPLPSRIITAADAYETMTTDRVYRGRLTLDAAVAELLANRGAQFDPVVVDTLVQMIEDGTVR